MTLKSAFIFSIAIHTAVIAPFYNPALKTEPVKKEMTVDYVILKEPAKTPVKDTELKIPEAPKVELKPKVETAPAPKAATEAKKDASQDLAERQARARTTKDYINYYQLLREKIRQKVRRSYRSSYAEGEVLVNFALRQDGSLVSCRADEASSTRDARLQDLAISSVRAASPFPPFPKALTVPSMDFNVTIVFKKDR